MRLVAFRIVNFRSIKDTRWHDLSTDNITGLIGQNESGKTSVLEALYSFYTGELDEDFLRDEKLYPEVSCSFELGQDELTELFPDFVLPDDLLRVVEKNRRRVNLVRTWAGLTLSNSALSLEQESLIDVWGAKEETSTPVAPLVIVPIAVAPTEPVIAAESVPVIPTVVAVEEPTTAVMPELSYEDFLGKFGEAMPEFEFFKDNASLLPATIDLADIIKKNAKAPGIKGAQNLLTISGITPEEISSINARVRTKKMRAANALLTKGFQDFWRQYIGKNNKIEILFDLERYPDTDVAKAGQPFLTFWVKDGQEILHPAQRSKGVQWFLSFFLQLKASAMLNKQGQILLIDEPGASLHAKAQEDVLKVFEDIKKSLQIVYTTHSPYLIQANTLYRLLAVQRASEDDDNSETQIFGVHELGTASEDTLLPIYTLIGVGAQYQQVIKCKNNVLLEEPSAFYYFKAFKQLINEDRDINFIPSSGVTKLPLLVNLFLGWGLDFIVLTDDDDAGKRVLRSIKADIYGGDHELAEKHLLAITGCDGVEDIFSKLDFRRHVLGDTKLKYAEKNSVYIGKGRESKIIAAVKFSLAVEKNEIKFDDLLPITQTKIKAIFDDIVSKL
jgi:ABC-type polar amino acid transport system ATPase subunit